MNSGTSRSGSSAALARESGAVTLEVFNPCSGIETTQVHAPRLDTLAGKTICEVSNASWEDRRTFARLRDLLQKRIPDLKIIPAAEFPMGSRQIDNDNIGDLVKATGAVGAIVGNAA
ncbi:MAG: hypothetical protein HYX92_15155 [Chloroflexi bacterium]|nr:hypothetical protein [Chloroflexota bacterium]